MNLYYLIPILLLLFFSSIATLGGASEEDVCMVVNQANDSSLGWKYFSEALMNWRSGLKSNAVNLYERALIADRGILQHDDFGMALALLDKYKQKAEKEQLSTSLLCKKAFFENVIIGNLKTAIENYRKAAELTQNPAQKEAALKEAERISVEVTIITNWQKELQKKIRIENAKDLANYLRNRAQREKEDEISELEGEVEDLEIKLADLKNRETEILGEKESYDLKARRRWRYYYYSNPYSSMNAQPSTSQNMEASIPGGGVIYSPLAGFGTTTGAPSNNSSSIQTSSSVPAYTSYPEGQMMDYGLYYAYRRASNELGEKLAQIREEISQTQKEIVETKSKIAEKNNPKRRTPVKNQEITFVERE